VARREAEFARLQRVEAGAADALAALDRLLDEAAVPAMPPREASA